MTMVVTDRTTVYDGSPTGENDVYTATGPIVVTFAWSGAGSSTCELWSRSDTADYVLTTRITKEGRTRIELVSGDNFYFVINPMTNAGNVDLSYVDA